MPSDLLRAPYQRVVDNLVLCCGAVSPDSLTSERGLLSQGNVHTNIFWFPDQGVQEIVHIYLYMNVLTMLDVMSSYIKSEIVMNLIHLDIGVKVQAITRWTDLNINSTNYSALRTIQRTI